MKKLKLKTTTLTHLDPNQMKNIQGGYLWTVDCEKSFSGSGGSIPDENLINQ